MKQRAYSYAGISTLRRTFFALCVYLFTNLTISTIWRCVCAAFVNIFLLWRALPFEIQFGGNDPWSDFRNHYAFLLFLAHQRWTTTQPNCCDTLHTLIMYYAKKQLFNEYLHLQHYVQYTDSRCSKNSKFDSEIQPHRSFRQLEKLLPSVSSNDTRVKLWDHGVKNRMKWGSFDHCSIEKANRIAYRWWKKICV